MNLPRDSNRVWFSDSVMRVHLTLGGARCVCRLAMMSLGVQSGGSRATRLRRREEKKCRYFLPRGCSRKIVFNVTKPPSSWMCTSLQKRSVGKVKSDHNVTKIKTILFWLIRKTKRQNKSLQELLCKLTRGGGGEIRIRFVFRIKRKKKPQCSFNRW